MVLPCTRDGPSVYLVSSPRRPGTAGAVTWFRAGPRGCTCRVPRFGTKEILAERFDQLADLRNCIRHSRAIDEVTQKLGEAAILWFRQALDK
jgi:hypothetical protein